MARTGVAQATSSKRKATSSDTKDRPRKKRNKQSDTIDIIEYCKSNFITVHSPGETEYERSVAHPNLLYRFSRPTCVVQPNSVEQIQEIVRVIAAHDIDITVKNGGHSYVGSATPNYGVVLDLKSLNKCSLDMDSMTMAFEGGALWGDAYKQLINGRHDGYMINGGRCPNVGMSGFLLGGGIGPFSREYGMGSDNLVEATVVTPKGELVTVKDSDNPTSPNGLLFWALRGGGQNSFGVLVGANIKVHQMSGDDGHVVAGRYVWFPDPEDKDLLPTMDRFYKTEWPEDFTIDSTWLMDLRQNASVQFGVRFLTYHDGNKHQFEKIIHKSIVNKDLSKQLIRRSLPEKSTRFLHETLIQQWSEETVKSFPQNPTYSLYKVTSKNIKK